MILNMNKVNPMEFYPSWKLYNGISLILINLEIKKKRGSSIDLGIHNSKFFSSEELERQKFWLQSRIVFSLYKEGVVYLSELRFKETSQTDQFHVEIDKLINLIHTYLYWLMLQHFKLQIFDLARFQIIKFNCYTTSGYKAIRLRKL